MPEGVEIPGWLIALSGGLVAIVASVAKFMKWAEERFLLRSEYAPPQCSVIECTKTFMPRPELEMALEHRAKRIHELSDELQKIVAKEALFERQIQRVEERQRWHGALLKAIAEKMGIDGIPLPPDE